MHAAPRFKLAVEGRDLLAALGTLGVVGMRSTTNHVMEALRVLGIEAARSTIMREIHRTMGAHGMTIDTRHTMLLADLMTYKARAPLLSSACCPHLAALLLLLLTHRRSFLAAVLIMSPRFARVLVQAELANEGPWDGPLSSCSSAPVDPSACLSQSGQQVHLARA